MKTNVPNDKDTFIVTRNDMQKTAYFLRTPYYCKRNQLGSPWGSAPGCNHLTNGTFFMGRFQVGGGGEP